MRINELGFSRNLTERQRAILTVIQACRSLTTSQLERTVKVLLHVKSDLPGFARALTTERYFGDRQDLEFQRELGLLIEVGLLERPYGTPGYISMTEDGERLARGLASARSFTMVPRKGAPDTIFVASAFGHRELDDLFHAEIKPACAALGYRPVRIDEEEPPGTITDWILRRIVESACLIGDLTFARPSVYFEIGFAQGLGLPFLLTCRGDHHRGKEDSLRVHFDVEQFKISYWHQEGDGKILWSNKMSPRERLPDLIYERSTDGWGG